MLMGLWLKVRVSIIRDRDGIFFFPSTLRYKKVDAILSNQKTRVSSLVIHSCVEQASN